MVGWSPPSFPFVLPFPVHTLSLSALLTGFLSSLLVPAPFHTPAMIIFQTRWLVRPLVVQNPTLVPQPGLVRPSATGPILSEQLCISHPALLTPSPAQVDRVPATLVQFSSVPCGPCQHPPPPIEVCSSSVVSVRGRITGSGVK